ncbi:MAG TPA: hypothetical protein VK533_10140 [Sphingomonas sp.]|uniref:hypothetical protein n=1 Tax=Sphingomonas sp. TaxID=28214 RepID=UPI002B90E472|nr:hypothetical protein [Sphingomonas sp.]HMI19893.1 hypothetical protein [Sphingomonas sp.]
MGLRRLCIPVALILLLAGCATESTAKEPTAVTVSRRLWFGICAGVCSSYDVTVSASGDVVTHKVLMDGNRSRHYRVTPEAAARFMERLRPFRPQGERRTHLECKHDVTPQEAELLLHVTEVEIRWRSSVQPGRLIACDTADDQPILDAIGHALAEIRLWPSGSPIPADYRPDDE